MANIYRSTAYVRSPSGKRYTVSSGPSASQAAADAEVNAKLAVTVGISIEKYVHSIELAEPLGALHATTAFEDAVLVLYKNIGGIKKTANVRVENMALTYLDLAIGNGMIDVTNADIASIASNYQDGTGATGYAFLPGASRYEK